MRPLTKSQAIVLTACTGCLMLDAAEFRKAVEAKLGRVVNATEFATQDFIETLQQTYAKEYQELLQVVEDSGIVLFK